MEEVGTSAFLIRNDGLVCPFDRVPMEILDKILCVTDEMRHWPSSVATWNNKHLDKVQYNLRVDMINFQLVCKTWSLRLQQVCIAPKLLGVLARNATEIVILREIAKLCLQSLLPTSSLPQARPIMGILAERGLNHALASLYAHLPVEVLFRVVVLEEALVHAAYTNMTDTIVQILQWRSQYPAMDMSETDIPHCTAIDCHEVMVYATIHQNIPVVKALLAAGYKDESYRHHSLMFTALCYAAELDSLEIANLLLKGKGVTDVNHANDYPSCHVSIFPGKMSQGCRPIEIACLRGNVEMARLLIQHGAKYITENGESFTPLVLAVEEEHLETLKFLMQLGAHPNRMTEAFMDRAPLMTAAQHDGTLIADYLLAQGADINMKGISMTPLISAVSCDNARMVKFYLARGANVNDIVSVVRGSALSEAVRLNNHQIISILLEAGADIDAGFENNQEHSARAEALRGKDPKTLELLGLSIGNLELC